MKGVEFQGQAKECVMFLSYFVTWNCGERTKQRIIQYVTVSFSPSKISYNNGLHFNHPTLNLHQPIPCVE